MPQVLNRPTLVLNRNWQPVRVATVARALVLLYRGAARVVDPSDYQTYDWNDWALLEPDANEAFIQGVTLRLRVPEVVTLCDYDRVPPSSVTFSRRNVFRRDRFTCQYCGCRPGSSELTIDHVVPRSQEGSTSWTNCVLACIECNHRKGSRTPEQAHMKLRRKPAQPRWQPRYAQSDVLVDSWTKFISEAYWNTELK